MAKDEKNEKKAGAERRKGKPFAWLGPMLERRKPRPEPIPEEEESQDLEDIRDKS